MENLPDQKTQPKTEEELEETRKQLLKEGLENLPKTDKGIPGYERFSQPIEREKEEDKNS